MSEFLTSKIGAVAITLLIFLGARRLYARWKLPIFNPVVVTILALMGLLAGLDIPYDGYMEGGQYIGFWLGPAVVALGVPLYQQLGTIRRNGAKIGISILLGSLAGILSATGLAALLGASDLIIISIAPKSVTTPIAMGIVERLGGIPPLAAAMVIFTGILGVIIGPALLRLLGVTHPVAFGLAMGAAAHGIGTSRSLEQGEVEGAMSGLALCVNGILTAILTPLLIRMLLAVFAA